MSKQDNVLHKAFKASHVAKRYFDKVQPGNKLTRDGAHSRYLMSIHLIDLNVLESVINDIYQEQLKQF